MTTTEQFSLRWTNFHSNITAGFHDLLEANDMVDVTLAVEGHFLQAHKIVLSICSPYFKQLFRVNPCKHPIVILKDVTHGNMKDILEFMYLGEVNVLRENLSAFLRTAELLQVKGLTGDDSSDTSSKKDDKTDSICDNDEEPDYAQLMEADGSMMMPQYPPEVPSPPQQKAIVPVNTKRHYKQTPTTNNNFKKIKQEATSTPLPLKVPNSNASLEVNDSSQTNEDEAEYIEMPSKLEQSYEKDGMSIKKEPFYDSSASFNNSMVDGNLQDHEVNGAERLQCVLKIFERVRFSRLHQCRTMLCYGIIRMCSECSKFYLRRPEKTLLGEDLPPHLLSLFFSFFYNKVIEESIILHNLQMNLIIWIATTSSDPNNFTVPGIKRNTQILPIISEV